MLHSPLFSKAENNIEQQLNLGYGVHVLSHTSTLREKAGGPHGHSTFRRKSHRRCNNNGLNGGYVNKDDNSIKAQWL
jgi:hypothetical protein